MAIEQKTSGKFITLKEAAELSGYSPDYLGQLIRKGKLAGKQVYLNVAWVTTEEAVWEYFKKNKVGADKGDFIIGLREKARRWVIAHTSADQIIIMARRVIYLLIAVLIAFCFFLIYALGANAMRAIGGHKDQAATSHETKN